MTLNPLVLLDTKLYLASADLTGFSNKVELAAVAEDLDKTTFASGGWKERVGGLFDTAGTMEGFFEAADLTKPDDTFWANLGVNTVPWTAVPTGGAVGDLAYLTRSIETMYKPGGEAGKLLGWSAELKGNWPLIRGQILHPQGTARTATGNGTGRQIGALLATQALYVNLHVLSYVDGSITVKIQSDDNSGFTTPTDQGTFTAATALGGQTLKISGAITDDWWRAVWTISGGVTHSFLFACSAGIGPK